MTLGAKLERKPRGLGLVRGSRLPDITSHPLGPIVTILIELRRGKIFRQSKESSSLNIESMEESKRLLY